MIRLDYEVFHDSVRLVVYQGKIYIPILSTLVNKISRRQLVNFFTPESSE